MDVLSKSESNSAIQTQFSRWKMNYITKKTDTRGIESREYFKSDVGQGIRAKFGLGQI
jgi:hypothetical protein